MNQMKSTTTGFTSSRKCGPSSASLSGLLSQMRTRVFRLGSPVHILKTTSLPLKSNQDTNYVTHTATSHICGVKTLNTTNQFPHTNVWERFRPNVDQFP